MSDTIEIRTRVRPVEGIAWDGSATGTVIDIWTDHNGADAPQPMAYVAWNTGHIGQWPLDCLVRL